jgi:PGM1 C-terminal domain
MGLLGPREPVPFSSREWSATDEAAFCNLQERLREMWPTITTRTLARTNRTVVVVASISFEVPDSLAPVFPAYEERFLFFVLSLLQQPGSIVIYVTSQPILPRIVDYYFQLVPELNTPDVRQRLFLVSPVDSSPRPLTEKIITRPRVVERIARMIPDPRRALIYPFNTSPLEGELGRRLDVPVYGPNPSLAHLGTKSGCRRLFAEEGVPHPCGVEEVTSPDALVAAIERMRSERPAAREVVVKLNKGVSGLGNGVVRIEGAEDRATLAERVRQIRLEDPDADAEAFFGALGEEAGIVEERIVAQSIRSPSVQMRCGPGGEYEVLSTHDQLLGGPHRQSFLGCRFPADQAYGYLIVAEALKIGARLAREGVVGRYGIDFVVTQSPSGEWRPYAIEINLRNGGTTHPFLTLQSLTNGDYDPQTNEFSSATGQAKYYIATDHLEAPEYARLTPDDLLDLLPRRGLVWQSGPQIGIAFHMISALAVAGRVGLTAVGDTPEQAEQLYARARNVLDEESGRI